MNDEKNPIEVKLSEEDLERIEKVQDSFNNIIISFGQLNIDKILLDNKKKQLELLESELNDKLNSTLVLEKEISVEFSQKYGTGILDPSTGVLKIMNKQ